MSTETPEVEVKLEEDLNYTAAKQFFTEISSIKREIYSRKAPMNSLMIIGVRRTVNMLLQRYQTQNLLMGEKVTTSLSNYSKSANVVFTFSKGLQDHLAKFIKTTVAQVKEEKANEKG